MFVIDSLGPATDGSELQDITLHKGPLRARIISFGAALAGLWHDAAPHSLTLALPRGRDYLDSPSYLGAIVGRVANRIADGRARIDGKIYKLSRNQADRHTLHGGRVGASHRNWTVLGAQDDQVKLRLVLPDGDMGFPGKLKITATYRLSETELSLTLKAKTNAPTLCNLTHHGYFNLDGTPDLRHHRLRVAAKKMLITDRDLIPTGEIEKVSGTPYDHRDTAPISKRLDHSYCLSTDPARDLHPIAWLDSPLAPVALELATTAPGLQAYSGRHLSAPFGKYQGIALEPQGWPDACHHPQFPSTTLYPNETYRQQISWRILTK